MDLVIPPTIYVAGPNLNDPSINRSTGRQPVKQAPIPEPSVAPSRESRESRVKGPVDPISLPPMVDAKGRLVKPTGTGTRLDVQA